MNKIKTVGSASISRSSYGIIISIDDEHSGDNILELILTPESYGLLCTGLGGVKGVMEVNPTAEIARTREVQTVVAKDIPRHRDKEQTKDLVQAHFNNSGLGEDGWMIHSYGTSSQQNNKEGYCYVIKRYVVAKDPTKIERKY